MLLRIFYTAVERNDINFLHQQRGCSNGVYPVRVTDCVSGENFPLSSGGIYWPNLENIKKISNAVIRPNGKVVKHIITYLPLWNLIFEWMNG